MQLRSFIGGYALTGSFAIIGQLLVLIYAFNWPALGLWSGLIQRVNTLQSTVPPPLQAAFSMLLVAMGILCILLAGLVVDLLCPLAIRHETGCFVSNCRLNKVWIEPYLLRNAPYVQSDFDDLMASWKPFWDPQISIAKNLKSKFWRIARGPQKGDTGRALRAPRAHTRLESLIIASILTSPVSQKLDLFLESIHFWETCRAIATAIALLTIETVGLLLWKFMWLFYPATDGNAFPPGAIAKLATIFGIEFLGLAIATMIARRAYGRVCFLVFALNYRIDRMAQDRFVTPPSQPA